MNEFLQGTDLIATALIHIVVNPISMCFFKSFIRLPRGENQLNSTSQTRCPQVQLLSGM